MQTKYDPSSNPYAQENTELESIAQSELPPVVKTGSLVALIAVILGTLIGSLLASPDPAEIAAQQEEAEVTTTTLSSEPESTTFESSTESSTATVTPPVTTPASPTTDITSTPSVTEATEPATDSDLTDSEIATSPTATPEADTTTATLEPEPVAPVTTPDPTADAEVSVTPTTPETPQAPVASGSVETPTTTDTVTGDSMPEIEPTTPETTTAVDPAPLATTGSEDIAAATAPDGATVEQLNQTVYQTIDRAWTTTPVTGESVYRVKVDQNGSILSFEPQSQVATENVDNTPLPGLASAQDVTATPAFAEFDVIFQPTGLLEVNQAE